jgi:hypothetical protein
VAPLSSSSRQRVVSPFQAQSIQQSLLELRIGMAARHAFTSRCRMPGREFGITVQRCSVSDRSLRLASERRYMRAIAHEVILLRRMVPGNTFS